MAKRRASEPRQGAPRAPRYAPRPDARAKRVDERREPREEPESVGPGPGLFEGLTDVPEVPALGPVASKLVAALGGSGAWGVAVVLAAALRLLHLVRFTRSPLAGQLLLDHAVYDTWAQRIAAGDWLGHGVFWVDPLYAYALAVVFKIAGHSLLTVRAAQCVMGVVTVALTGVIAKRVSGRASVGHAAMLVAAVFPPLIHNEAQIEKATLTTLLATAALAAFVKGTRRSLTLAGILTGLAVLGRGNLLFAIPAGALALAFERRDEADPTVRVAGRALSRLSLGRAGRFTLAASAVVGLLTLRNVVVGHELLLTTSIGGPSLYAAQLRTNTSATYNPPPFVRPASEFEHDDFHAEAERRTGRRMTDSEVNGYFAREALGEMFWAPGATLERSLRKLRLAFHDYEVSDNDDVYLTAAYSPVLNLPLFWVGQVAPFALLGAIVAWRRARAARAAAGAVAVYAATLVLFYVMGRLRLPMAPALIALGATGAAWLVERAYARDTRRGLAGAAIVLLAALPCLVWSGWIDDMRSSTLAVACNNIAAQLQRAGRTDDAIAMYERAIETRPAMVIGAMRTLGDLYLSARRYDDAERVMRLVLSHKPDSPLGKQALVRLYEAMAADPSTGGMPAVRARLAAAYRAVGRNAEAAQTQGASGSGEPRAAEAPATPTQAAPPIEEAARTAMVQTLSEAPRGSPVWITATAYDPRAISRSEELATLFRRAGWDVRAVGRSMVRVRPGLFLFAADDAPPSYVDVARRAAEDAHLEPTLSGGYRAFYDERMRMDPEFQGFPLAPEQTWVLVVGRIP